MVLTFTQTVLAIASGSVVGFSLGLVGGGGSILAVPLLVYVVGLDNPHIAIGTSAIAVALNAASNLAMHARSGNVKWYCAGVFAAAGVAGAFLGSTLGKMMDGQRLLALFAVLMMVVGALMLRGRARVGDSIRHLVAREPAEAAGTGPDGRNAFRLLRHRRRLPDRAGPDAGDGDADPECGRLVARFGHRVRADDGGELCLVRTGGLALGRTIRGRRSARRTARRPLGKIACQPKGRADDGFRGADLCRGGLHAGSQPQPDLRSDRHGAARSPDRRFRSFGSFFDLGEDLAIDGRRLGRKCSAFLPHDF